MTVTHPQVSESQRRLLDIKDLSARWGISVPTIRRKRSLGEPLPPAMKIGALVRWSEDTVAAWEAAQQESA